MKDKDINKKKRKNFNQFGQDYEDLLYLTNSNQYDQIKSANNKYKNKNLNLNIDENIENLINTDTLKFKPEQFKSKRKLAQLNFDNQFNTQKVLKGIKQFQSDEKKFNNISKQKCSACLERN